MNSEIFDSSLTRAMSRGFSRMKGRVPSITSFSMVICNHNKTAKMVLFVFQVNEAHKSYFGKISRTIKQWQIKQKMSYHIGYSHSIFSLSNSKEPSAIFPTMRCAWRTHGESGLWNCARVEIERSYFLKWFPIRTSINFGNKRFW